MTISRRIFNKILIIMILIKIIILGNVFDKYSKIENFEQTWEKLTVDR